jgi:preprotein translocase subunit YajC
LETFEILPTDSTPQETFQLLFLIVSALMLTMGFILYRRVKNRRRRGDKTTDAMQRR